MFNLFKKKDKVKILPIEKHIKTILKNKELSANQKFELVKERYMLYYMYQMYDEANMATFELHYENFMTYNKETKKYVKDVEAYDECFDYELKKLSYFHAVKLCNVLETLKQEGLNEEKLSTYGNQFFTRITTLKENCGLDKNFPFDEYYTNDKIKNHVDRFVKYFFDDFEKDINNEIENENGDIFKHLKNKKNEEETQEM